MTFRAIMHLAMILALAYGARSFVPAGETITGSGAALAFGFLLIAAIQIGRIATAVRLPQLTGYIVCGLLFGPQMLDIVSEPMLADLALVKGTAVGLIALLAGCELNFARLRPALRAITAMSAATLLLSAVALFTFFMWVTTVLPVSADYSTTERAAIALVCANVLIAFSPAVVIGLISETRSSGPLSQLCMSIVVLADLALVVTFALTMSVARTVFPAEQGSSGVAALLVHIFGSIAAGVGVGAILAIYIRRVSARTGLMVFALLFIVAEAGRALHLDPLLVGLTAGLLIENVSKVSGDEIVRAAQPVTLPMFAIFFAVVGAEIPLKAFLHVAQWAVAVTVIRAIAIFVGSKAGAYLGRIPEETAKLVPFGLLPQAGVAIALAVLVLNDFPPWGRVFGTVLLGTIVLSQLIGPVLFRFALERAGEIGKGAGHETMEPAESGSLQPHGERTSVRRSGTSVPLP